MIILSALEIKDDPTYEVLPNNPYWHCIGFSFEGIQYDIAFECGWYGQLIRQFAINGKVESPVEDKYMIGEKVNFAECNSLCGVRDFEQGSISYEFLLKPLGLPKLSYAGGYQSVWYESLFVDFCKKNSITYKQWIF